MESFTQAMDGMARESPLGPALSRRLFLAGAARAAGLLGVAGAVGTSATKEASAAAPSTKAGDEFDFVPPFNPQAKHKATFAHDAGSRSMHDFYYKYFQTRLTALTKGEMSINVVPASGLGAPEATAKSVRAGTLEMTVVTGAILGGVISPEFALFDLPYLIKSWGHFMRVVFASPFVKKIREVGLSKGVYVLTPYHGGLRHIFYKGAKPILKPEDLKGVKLRTMPAPLDVALWNATGAEATPISFAEVYSALQQGVVDGVDNAFSTATSMKFDELVKNVSLTAYRYQVTFPIASDKWFKSLPQQYREYFLQVADEASIYATGVTLMEEEAKLPTLWMAKGIGVHMPDRKAFEEKMSKVYPQFVPKMGGQENVESILKMQ